MSKRDVYYTPDFSPIGYTELAEIFDSIDSITTDAVKYVTMAQFDGHTAIAVNLFGYPSEILHSIDRFAERTGYDKEDFVFFVNALFSNDDRETYLIMEYNSDDAESEYDRYNMTETVYYPTYGSDDAYGFHIQLSGDTYTEHDDVMTLRKSVVIR